MTYYYNKNSYNHEGKTPYTKKNIKDPTSNFQKTDSLIVDNNTVYEIDEECIKKYLNSINKNK